jgi:phosphate acyltransferase
VTRIAVDAMGGDRAPDEIVAGALAAAGAGVDVVLFGPQGLDSRGLELVVCPTVIEMAEKPSEAVRAKPDSSLVGAVRAVADGHADAVVSAGNTGAMLAAGLMHLRRLPGVARPAIAVPIPARNGPCLLIDGGANADARPDHLLQFAIMGTLFAQDILRIADPPVWLLSNGSEPEKGDALRIESYALLTASGLRFRGNIEGGELLRGGGEVVVSDGFTGNIALKMLEGTIKELLDQLRGEIAQSTRGKLGGLLIRPAARRLRLRLDPETYGGAYLLGLQGLAVVAHGNSSRKAISNAIALAARGVEQRVVERLGERLPSRPRLAEPASDLQNA